MIRGSPWRPEGLPSFEIIVDCRIAVAVPMEDEPSATVWDRLRADAEEGGGPEVVTPGLLRPPQRSETAS
jgi:hypothetical protein